MVQIKKKTLKFLKIRLYLLGPGARAGGGLGYVLIHSFVSGWHCSSGKQQRIWPRQLTAQSHSNRLHQWNALAGLKVDCRETSWMEKKKSVFELVFPFMGWKFPSTVQILLASVVLFSKKWRKKSESLSHSVVSYFLQPHGRKPARLLCPWDSPGKNTGVGCHSLLQGIFLT